jgi:putative transposase
VSPRTTGKLPESLYIFCEVLGSLSTKQNTSLDYKRKSHIEIGSIYFWTATINKWQRLLEPDGFKHVIIQSLDYLSTGGRIDVFAFVIMPNHIHTIWRMNERNGKETPSGSFLKFTAHEFKKMLVHVPVALKNYRVDATNKSHESWQRDSLAVHLYTREVAYQKLRYIHNNPLSERWQLAVDPCDYWFSSARFYERGVSDFGFLKDLRDEF